MHDDPTVFVVDDDEGFREALRWLLTSVGLHVETHASGTKFLGAYETGRRGCLLLDVRMPGMSGLQVQKELTARDPDLPVIILTGHGDVSMAVDAMKKGAFDFLEKPFDNETLLERVRRAIEGADATRRERAKAIEVEERLSVLTARERQILDLVVAGETSKAIALRLDVSPRTVEVHRASMMSKLDATSLADLIRIARL